MRGQISIRHASAITLIAIVTLAACVPPPTGPGPTTPAVPTPTTTVAVVTTPTTPPHFPVIGAFAAAKPAGASPLTTALTWSISDPDGGSLTCGLDVDNNGSYETTVIGCTSASSRTSTFTGAGPHVVGLSVSDGMNTTTTTTTVTVGAASADAFAITVRINGSMTTNQQNAFTNAANRWAALVKGGLADVNLNIGADNCLAGMAAFSGTIDDLLIDAQIATIDGAGGILGLAGPCYTRSSGGLPVYGVMQFDSADVGGLEATGRL